MTLGNKSMMAAVLWVVVASYVVFVFFPRLASTQITGYTAQYAEKGIVVGRVFPGSPADLGGLRGGDLILNLDGYPAAAWQEWYRSDPGTYAQRRGKLLERAAPYSLLRDESPINLNFGTRELAFREIVSHYGARIFLILFILALTAYILVSRTRERNAFLTCLCFCFSATWFASQEIYRRQMISPLIQDLSAARANTIDLIEAFALQLAIATLLHIAINFPRGGRHQIGQSKWVPVTVYAAALAVPVFALFLSSGDLSDRISRIYGPRLYVNTALAILIAMVMINNYRRCEMLVSREQARWVVGAIGIVVLVQVFFWNIPTMIWGRALVPDYDWILLTMALLPISLTMSINNHDLFGVRGMIRGRIRLLEARLAREKRMVNARDASMRNLRDEIEQLKNALSQHEALERGEEESNDGVLEALEREYPQLLEIRQKQLLGISTLWNTVYQEIVIAAQGLGPVIVVGESGTGKTHVANAIHQVSERKDRAYKAISCAQFEHADPAFALGRLFGIAPGHGLPNVAKEGQPGILEECDGGSLFLDDFDRLPMPVQDLFLYPLEGKPFEPGIGSGPSRRVSIKFIFATNRSPEQLTAQGRLREDVLARMMTRVDIPPLRERKEDIPALIEHFVREISADLGHDISVVTTKSLNAMCGYHYRAGNVRELKAELHKAIGRALLEHDNVLRSGYLSEKLVSGMSHESREDTGETPSRPRDPEGNRELQVLRNNDFRIAVSEQILGYSSKSKTISNHLRGMCIQALMECQWNTDAAARLLAGSDNDAVVRKLRRRMERLESSVRDHIAQNTQDKLFNNLPVRYHESLRTMIDQLKV